MNSRQGWLVLAVLIFTLGNGFTFAADSSASPGVSRASADEDPTVYVTDGGKKYHKKNCRLVATGKKGIKLSEALDKGYEPCKICLPPEPMVYVNPSGTVYHKKSCKMVKKDAVRFPLSEATGKGLKACKICFPPDKDKK